MDGNDVGAAPATAWRSQLRRPKGLVEQTRWLFGLCALLSLALTLPGALLSATSVLLPPMTVAAAVLVIVWLVRYLSGRAAAIGDMAETAAVATLAVTGADPAAVFGFVFSALWFRALYGSTRRVMLLCLGLAAALIAALPLWGVLPEHDGTVPVSVVLSSVVNMFLTTGVARYLALGLFAREQAQSRDAALVRLGHLLLAVTDRTVIRERARDCAVEICDATPGLSAVFVQGDRDSLTVVDHTGALDHVPPTLPRSAMSCAPGGDQVKPVADRSGLPDGSGPRLDWVSVATAGLDDGAILLAAPRRVHPEAVVAVQSMTHLIALAMRNSDAHQDLTTQANHDALTGLANRAAFTAALERALTTPDERIALLFIDLDDFKTVNDGLGHAAGDDLLRTIAGRLRRAVRPDDLCARLGGDEFAVLLRDADDTAVAVAQRLVDLVATPVALRGRLATVGASVGLAFAASGFPAEELVQRADVAMYAAKAKGKNRVQAFDPSLFQDDGEAAFEAEVGAAAGAGELVVHYQPIMSVADDRCVAVEALVRWQHPRRGLLTPAEFIGTAERTGAIVDIGSFVLRRACADASTWANFADRVAIHVNVSAAQLTDPGFIDTVRNCIDEHGLEPGRLVLEVTEGMVLDSTAVRSSLDRLVALGVAIAIDDFGTGYSALSIIRTLPLDIVKLDKSFLSPGTTQVADQVVIAAVVQMAGRLGLTVVAEGVERIDQQQFLRRVGVDATQGHLHLRPTPALPFTLWLQRHSGGRRAAGTATKTGHDRPG